MRRKGVSYAKYGYIFVIPFVLAFIAFSLYPTIFTAIIGFTDFKGMGKTDFKFLTEDVFRNYKTVMANPSFKQSLSNTFSLWIVNFIPQILLALLLTGWFTSHRRKIKGQGVFKVLFYMPNIITQATVAILFNSLFLYPQGPVNDFLVNIGILKEPMYFILNATASRGIVSFIQFWMWYGSTMIVLISGVLGINPELFEAAEIDGASGSQIFFRITLPNIRTILVFTLVTSLIGGLQMFDIPRLFLNGGPDSATLTTSLFVYNQAFAGSYLYNRASAASMIMWLIIIALSAVVFYLMRDKDAAKLNKLKRQQTKAYKASQREARRASV